MTNNQLTHEQVEQLLKAALKSPSASYFALKDGPRFSAEQQQRLVDVIAQDSFYAHTALTNIEWLPSEQKAQLKVVK